MHEARLRFSTANVILALSLVVVPAVTPADCGQLSDATDACQRAASQIDDGRRRMAQKDFPRAIQELRSALELCPSSTEAALELARAYLTTRQFSQAEETAARIVANDRHSEQGLFLLAYSYFMQERFQEAGKTLRKLLDQNSQNADAHKLMGLTLFFYKQYVIAERELQMALRLHPQDEEALYYLGRVYYTQNNFPPAVSTFRRLIGINPKSYKAIDNLGLCYQAQGKIDDAIVAFRKAQALARDLDPGYDWPFANLAELLIQENRAHEALPYAREAVRIKPQSARNQFLLGKALARTGDLQAALDCLRKSAELDPNYAEPHYLLGQVYQKRGQRAEADREFALFEKISKRTPHKRL